MSETLIINFATRGRSKQFLSSLKNITETIYTDDYRILVSCDKDDESMDENIVNVAMSYPNVTILFSEPTSKVGAINATVKYFGKFYWCINHSDDFVYTVKNWDKKMLEAIKSVWGDSTDFFAHFSDNRVKEKLPTMNICGYDYFKRDNCIYSNTYGSICCDAENMFVAQQRGCYHYFPEVYIDHIHPANIPSMEVDATYRRNDRFGEADIKNYFERMSYGFHVENPVYVPAEVQEHINKRLANESK